MKILIVVVFICICGGIAPFLLTALYLSIEEKLHRKRQSKREEVILLTNEVISGILSDLKCEGNENLNEPVCVGSDTAIALKSLVIFQLKARHLRFIKREYGDVDKWIQKRIHIFLYELRI